MKQTSQKIQAIVFRYNEALIEYLVLRRTQDKKGIWQPVTGNFDSKDKDVLATCTRELKEEIGISKPKNILENIYSFIYQGTKDKKDKEFEEHVFGVEVELNQEIILQSTPYIEHQEYVWTSYDGAFELFEFIEQKEALNRLHKMLLKENNDEN